MLQKLFFITDLGKFYMEKNLLSRETRIKNLFESGTPKNRFYFM